METSNFDVGVGADQIVVDTLIIFKLHHEPARPSNVINLIAIQTPTVEIPWPVGMTFSEALLAWKAAP
jgi:hypothetical protein